MELKEQLQNAGVPEDIIECIEGNENHIKNQESVEVGDTITIKGYAPVGKGKINGTQRKWINFSTDGDRCTISLTNLIGTKKLRKHFPDYTQTENTVRLNNDERIAVVEAQKLFGKTLKCVRQKEVELPFTNTNSKGEEVPATQTYNVWEIQ